MFFHRSAQSLPSLRLSLAAYAVVVLAGLPIGRAEPGPPPRPAPFSAALSAAEFSGAGLGKLTEAELQELNRLVRAHESGELARAREAARLAEAEAERVVREAKATAERHATAAAAAPAPSRSPAATSEPGQRSDGSGSRPRTICDRRSSTRRATRLPKPAASLIWSLSLVGWLAPETEATNRPRRVPRRQGVGPGCHHWPVSLARLTWLLVTATCAIGAVLLFVAGYQGYGVLAIVIGLAASINIR